MASGAIMSLAFPPVDLGALAYVSLVPLAVFFRRPGRAGALATALCSAGLGAAFFPLLVSWIRLFGMPAYLALVTMESLILVLCLQVGRLAAIRLTGGWRAAGFPIAFLAAEYVRSHLPFGGFPWGGLGYSQHDNLTALRVAPYTGVWGVTLMVAAVNAMVAEAIERVKMRPVLAALWIVAAWVVALAPAILPAGRAEGRSARIAIVQGNAPENLDDFHADDRQVFLDHLRLSSSLDARALSLVVWPESAIEVDPLSDPTYGAPLAETIRAAGVPFVVGASIDLPGRRFVNTSLFFRADGTLAGRYVKQHLVPFGEYVPLRSFLEPLVKDLQRVPRDGIPGKRSEVFQLSSGTFASVICYESTYPDLVRSFVSEGARLIVVSTNNASFERTSASRQHVAFSQLRAAEHRMWVAHAALTGISAVVDPSGRVLESTPLFRPAVLSPTVRFSTGTTLYGRLGDWLPAGSLGLVAAGLVAGVAGRIRGRSSTAASVP
ncbi:MAG: apolipoprotein N-acyltransferase [Actinomycetota bacterium]